MDDSVPFVVRHDQGLKRWFCQTLTMVRCSYPSSLLASSSPLWFVAGQTQSSTRGGRVTSDLKECENIVQKLRRDDNAWPFHVPVKEKEVRWGSFLVVVGLGASRMGQRLSAVQPGLCPPRVRPISCCRIRTFSTLARIRWICRRLRITVTWARSVAADGSMVGLM